MAPSTPALAGATPYLLYLIGISVIAPLQFGYHLTELNTPSDVIRCLTTNSLRIHGLPKCIPMDETTYGAVSSVFTLGGLIGALAAGPYSSRKGRISPMRLTAPFYFVGSILASFAVNTAMMGIGRFLSGIGAGASIVIVPIYISEIAPANARGILGASTQVSINMGILVSAVLGYFFSTSDSWRIILIVGIAVSGLQGVGMAGVAESPEWLASKGRVRDATNTLQKIRGGDITEETSGWGRDGNADAEESEGLLGSDSANSGSKANRTEVGFFEVARHPDHWRAIVAVVAVMVSQQFSGINAVMMYSVPLLKDIIPEAGLITVAVAVLNIVVTAACAPLADKLGRKVCLLGSIAGMAVNAVLIGVGFARSIKMLCVVCTFLFVASFAAGLGPVPFILASELVGPEAVGAAQSWALGASWIATFTVAQFVPILKKAIGEAKLFFLFAVMGLVAFAFISWWVPESKGKKDANEVWGRSSTNEHVD